MKQEKLLKVNEEGNKELLVMEVFHRDGKYKLNINKETEVQRGDYAYREFILYAQGNMNIVLGNGRKSDKKLQKLNNILSDNFETFYNTWVNNEGNSRAVAEVVWSKTNEVFN